MAAELKGKIALITGAGSGIGRATALVFARAGARLALVDLRDTAEATAAEVRAGGSEAQSYNCDVSQAAAVREVIEQVVAHFGRLDCAFNNAGISGKLGTVAECTEENWSQVLATNLTGVWLCMKYEIQQMLKQGGGAIVNTASVAGLIGAPMIPAYCAAKHGVVGLTRTAALENATAKIRVNAVCPGVIETPMVMRSSLAERLARLQPINRIGKPEEIAEAVLWLCSDSASLMTGCAMPVDGGITAR